MFRTPNPKNPFHSTHVEREEELPPAKLDLRVDHAQSVLAENDSPDVPFRWSLNVYRGCSHACAYCYARRTHEYLDLGAGEDFERVIVHKPDAPRLLEAHFQRPSWVGEPVNAAGVTDCYQPVEAKLGLMRACLEVFARYRNPITILTRSPLILRDLDLLRELAAHGAVRVQISVPVLDETFRRALEPGTRPAAARLDAVHQLAQAGIPVGVSLAPVIPGLTDVAIPKALAAAAEAGAAWVFMGLVRLPGSVADVFEARLRHTLPGRADAVMDRIRRARGGALGGGGFGDRMRGHDLAWQVIQQQFRLERERLGLADRPPPFADPSPFRRPVDRRGQLALF